MGAAATKAVGNVYYEARKKAAMYNDRLSSREGAAEALGISPSTLADYELGLTKFVPVENVIRMADVYNAPQLKPHYCKNVCPIGCEMPVATEETSIELAVRNGFKPEQIETSDVSMMTSVLGYAIRCSTRRRATSSCTTCA